MRGLQLTLAAVLFFTVANLSWAGAPAKKSSKKAPERAEPLDFSKKSFKQILDSYVFIADFATKPDERLISKEVFWKYPFKLAPVTFDLDFKDVDLNSMVFQVKGSGARAEALNIGRVAFLSGNFTKAHQAWLTGREDFKDDPRSARTFDFFLAVNAMAAYRARAQLVQDDSKDSEIQALSKRLAYFFASTYLQKNDSPDERIDRHASWGLYNLAVVYYRFGRMRSAYGAAQEGLSILLKQGSATHRSELRQILAEAYIKNRDLLSAIQEIDTAIRQDPNEIQATRMFSRAADIYYDLNNYELAEDFYALSSAIDRERLTYNPEQAVLRAESIFWLGRFDESEKLMRGAVEYSLKSGASASMQASHNLPWAALRIADAMLARSALATGEQRSKQLDKSRLAYFKVESDFPKTEAAEIASIRGACLELPTYQGNNVKHARQLLEDVKRKNEATPALMELVWACEAASYSEREKNDEMVSKVRKFAERYPRSRYLDAMLPSVRTVQAAKINDYFSKQDWASATDFFEQKRSALFQSIPNDIAANLWTAYVATGRSGNALQFWSAKPRDIKSDVEALRQAAFLFEATSTKASSSLIKEREKLNQALSKRVWSKKPNAEQVGYVKRVLATSGVASAYPWLMNIQDAWYKLDERSTCETLFPLMSRVFEDKQSGHLARRLAQSRVKGLAEALIESIRKSDASCFQSWLDLEAKVLDVTDLQKKYDARLAWPLEGPWLETVWTLSEQLNNKGKTKDATAIWQKIAEKAPKDSFESRMARTRLDPTKTEFESLWK